VKCALHWQIVNNQRFVLIDDLLFSNSRSKTKLWSRVNKAKTINLKQIKILYVYNFVLNYITIYDFFST